VTTSATSPQVDRGPVSDPEPVETDASVVPEPVAVPPPPPPPPPPPERWLKGSTHVHAAPSGDSSTPIPEVIAWYERHGYDFIALTDHNRVSEVDPERNTAGSPAVRAPASGLIVLAGSELTFNPVGCRPVLHPSRKCRIHVNLIGITARPVGKIDWADRSTNDRLEQYSAALTAQRTLGGLAQINHPQWFWGMTADQLIALARRGMVLFEIANMSFPQWNRGDRTHPSTEALWDAALAAGVTVWGIATDDAHSYDGRGKYRAGAGWIAVKARRDPQAILDAIAAGRFYSSTGVELVRAEVETGDLVVEVKAPAAAHEIRFIEGGKVVAVAHTGVARRAVPATGTLRAVVVRGDGGKAWTQPVRR
jgi:hypothetical protein